MKYCVIHNLRFETPAKKDNLDQAVRDNIAGKETWGETNITHGTGEEGFPFHSLMIRFENQADMDDLFALVKNKIDTIPVLKGKISKHRCRHDEGTLQPCQLDEEYGKD